MIEPVIDALTTSPSPLRRAVSPMIISAALPNVALSSPPTPALVLSASSSVVFPSSAASGTIAADAAANAAKCRCGANQLTATAIGTNARRYPILSTDTRRTLAASAVALEENRRAWLTCAARLGRSARGVVLLDRTARA